MGPIGLRAILTIEAANRSNLSIVSSCVCSTIQSLTKRKISMRDNVYFATARSHVELRGHRL